MRRIDAAELEPKSELTDDDRKQLLEAAIQKNEKLAESGVEMAKLFLEKGKRQIAKSRLRRIVEEFGGSEAAREAKALLKKL
jgi:outer membrane protein assembly factor BamD (BamD/ComL family)